MNSGYIYFDNAATTYPKPEEVKQALFECVERYCANPGRSTHRMALRSSEAVYEVRELISEFIGCELADRIVFETNATYALNTAIRGLVNHKCHVITSDLEHNSVLRPLYRAQREYGCEISSYRSDNSIRESITEVIRDDTEFIVTSIASNVTGRVTDIESLSEIASERGIKLIIDASQYIGHFSVNVKKTPIDVLCAPGHKALFGIQGSGFMYVRDGLNFPTLVDGGGGSDTFNSEMPEYLPERFEAGTLNTPAIVSLGAGIKFITSLGEENIKKKIESLTSLLKDVLVMNDADIYGCNNGIASFSLRGISPSRLSVMLDEYGIATRSGLHCAPLVHKRLGTEKSGLVRVSLSIMNNENELDRFSETLKKIRK
ncbi:MAG: aminotransferase class V-fold PLP-dependent enzyme [Clostridia bacterium]|nr:aminotransferase class V-fold PLP-dependent enzyme [Clostridia bacterium]